MVGTPNVKLYDDLVRAYACRRTDYVIESNGKKLNKIDLSKAYERAGLGDRKRRQHLLKHTCCSLLVQSGASFEAVASLIATRANIIEKHYGHLSPKHLETVADTLSF